MYWRQPALTPPSGTIIPAMPFSAQLHNNASSGRAQVEAVVAKAGWHCGVHNTLNSSAGKMLGFVLPTPVLGTYPTAM